LRLPSLRRGKPRVLAARAQLGNLIRWAHSSDVPDVARLLVGGELLLVTGMGVGRGVTEQRRFIRSLGETGVAGVIVELGRVFAELPATMVLEAERRGVLLIALEREVPFVDVTREIHTAIVDVQLSMLRRADELSRRLTMLMFEGAGIPELLAALASAVRNPVILEKSGGEVIYHSRHRSEDASVMAAWDVHRDDIGVTEDHDDQHAASRLVPSDGGRTWGRLVVLGLDTPLTGFERLATDRATALVGLTLLRNHEESLLATRERGNFLADVLARRIDPADALARAQTLGFDHRRGPLLGLAVAPTVAGDDGAAWAPVWQALRGELEERALPALLGAATPEETLLLIGLSSSERRAAVAEVVASTLRAAGQRELGQSSIGVVAVGPAVDGWGDVPAALKTASDTAALARSGPVRSWHDATVADVDRLLLALRDDVHLLDFVEQRLGAVRAHDRQRTAKLMPTLEALCDHGWRKADTARALHLDRKSLYPRIERLERLLGASLDDPKTRLSLELAICAISQEPAGGGA